MGMTIDEALKVWLPVIQMGIETMQECKEALDMAIKALEQEPKTGHWIKSRDSYGNNHFTCPFCEHDIATKADTWEDNYCSNCGAKMVEPQK